MSHNYDFWTCLPHNYVPCCCLHTCCCLHICLHVAIVYKDEQTGRPNLEIWKGEEKVVEFIQKKMQSWSEINTSTSYVRVEGHIPSQG